MIARGADSLADLRETYIQLRLLGLFDLRRAWHYEHLAPDPLGPRPTVGIVKQKVVIAIRLNPLATRLWNEITVNPRRLRHLLPVPVGLFAAATAEEVVEGEGRRQTTTSAPRYVGGGGCLEPQTESDVVRFGEELPGDGIGGLGFADVQILLAAAAHWDQEVRVVAVRHRRCVAGGLFIVDGVGRRRLGDLVIGLRHSATPTHSRGTLGVAIGVCQRASIVRQEVFGVEQLQQVIEVVGTKNLTRETTKQQVQRQDVLASL